MAELNFLKKIVKNFSDKSDEKEKGSAIYWNKIISDLSNKELLELTEFSLECHGIRLKKEKLLIATDAIKNNKNFEISSDLIDVELGLNRNVIINILGCVAASENLIDSALYLPPQMRNERLSKLAQSIGVEVDFLLKVDSKWRSLP